MSRVKRETQFWESALMNNATYIQYYNRLMELSIAMFEWKNLPDGMDERFLELILFCDGKAVVFYDEEVNKYLGLQFTYSGQLDMYHIPTGRRAYAINGYNRQLNEKDSVIVWNNLLHTPSKLDVEMMSKRLYNFDRIIDVNVNAQKTPVLLQCDDSQRLTMKNLYKEFDGNAPFIFGTKALDSNGLKVLKTDAPFIADQIYQLKTQYWNEALTYLGISNTNVMKKERLITDEVVRNMGGVIASRYSRLEARRKACDQINEMFGTELWVDFREDYRQTDDEFMILSETDTAAEFDNQKVVSPMAEDLRTRSKVGADV